MEERRAHQRYPVGECGLLRILTSVTIAPDREAYVCDVSDGGLAVHLDTYIEVGHQVQVMMSACTFLGHIKYCRRRREFYIVGIQLDPNHDHKFLPTEAVRITA